MKEILRHWDKVMVILSPEWSTQILKFSIMSEKVNLAPWHLEQKEKHRKTEGRENNLHGWVIDTINSMWQGYSFTYFSILKE